MNRMKKELTKRGILGIGREDDFYSSSTYLKYIGQGYIAVSYVSNYLDDDGIIIYDKNLNVVEEINGCFYESYYVDYEPTAVKFLGYYNGTWDNYTINIPKVM